MLHAIKDYLNAPADQTVLGRALLHQNRLGLLMSKLDSAICYLFTRGGLLAIGALLAWSGYELGFTHGSEIGFKDGFSAVSRTERCQHEEDSGKRIRTISHTTPVPAPGTPLTDNQTIAVASLCAKLIISAPAGVARHYGCAE